MISDIAMEICANHHLFQIERPDGNNVVSFLNCFYYQFFQDVFLWIVNADECKFNSDLCKEASKLSALH